MQFSSIFESFYISQALLIRENDQKLQKKTIFHQFSAFFNIFLYKQGLRIIYVSKISKSIMPVYKRWMTKNVKKHEKS